MSRTVKNKPTKSLKHKRDVLKWRNKKYESNAQFTQQVNWQTGIFAARHWVRGSVCQKEGK